MNNFTQRTLSGIVYVAIVVSSIIVHPILFCAVFTILTMLAVREFMTLMQAGKTQTLLTALLGGLQFIGMWSVCQYYLPFPIYTLLGGYAFLLIILLLLELFLKNENPIQQWGYILQSQLMIALPFSLMNILLGHNPYLLLALFITIWVNDSGAYIVGSLLAKRKGGNHKMFVRVSPKKSWEGLIGGIVAALLAGYVFYIVGWIPGFHSAQLITLVAAIAGTFGDLMESLMKRTIGVKDSGNFMPGHGGVLDRFDSLLLAAPVVVLLMLILY